MSIFDIIFGKKKEEITEGILQHPLYISLCQIAGLTSIINPQQLGNYLLNVEQEEHRTGKYFEKGMRIETASLYPIAVFVEQNFDSLRKELSIVLIEIGKALLPFYIHAAGKMISIDLDYKRAEHFVSWGIKITDAAGIDIKRNPAFLIMDAFLRRNIAAFETLIRVSRGTGWGWDGGNVYEGDFTYMMHALLKGLEYGKIESNLKSGKIRIKYI